MIKNNFPFIFKLESVSYLSNRNEILKDITLQVDPNEKWFILGNNGSGKSTLLDVLLGNLKASGNIQRNLSNKDKIGLMLDGYPFSNILRVKEIIKLYRLLYSISEEKDRSIYEILELDGIKDKQIGKLSTGEKKRVGLFTALFHFPELIILDEPMSGIDPNSQFKIHKLIFDLPRTVLIASHDWEAAKKFADKIFFIYRGKQLFSNGISVETLLSDQYIPFKEKLVIQEGEIEDLSVVYSKVELYLKYDQQIMLFGFNEDLISWLNENDIVFTRTQKSLNDVYYYLIKNES
ncbi:ATP-binding cassette domain-containing protein [Sphingobacterium endophyticum]|uniref:ATP-binding cassette domain-containing protein n=1 Tax=Sphingobacterium endophyticum TaxID=2546448 RepID=UPI0012E234A0|nr:ABC transporter ATP-binding protein [Sphingobacterium endophyticum]